MSKTIQFIRTDLTMPVDRDGNHKAAVNAILSGDTISMGQHKYTLQESDAIRLLCWCEDLIKNAERRRQQRQRLYTGCCDDIRPSRVNDATDPAPANTNPKRW